MSKLSYFLATFAESALSVFGIRGTYDHPSYRVLTVLAPGIEIRAYAPRTVAETAIGPSGDGAAFGKLFDYIAGGNVANRTLAMTVPVEQAPPSISDTPVMRFFLPPAREASGPPPTPSDPAVRLVTLPSQTMAVLRYSGNFDAENRTRHLAQLRASLTGSGKVVTGDPVDFAYDPPFTLPFLRRNEVALPVAP